jgi:hypothetical protein
MRSLILSLLLVSASHAAEPLKALLITGGCCHDYAKQHEIIAKGIQSRANVQVDVIWTDDKSTNPPLPIYDKVDWAKGYDIIIHDECAASMNNKETLTRILDAHKTIPSIQLHCAMHSFRTGEDRWFKRLGLQSNSHGPQEPIAITFVDQEHPITKTLADWTTIKEELSKARQWMPSWPGRTKKPVPAASARLSATTRRLSPMRVTSISSRGACFGPVTSSRRNSSRRSRGRTK